MGVPYCETSATNFDTTSQAFDGVIRKILKHKKKEISSNIKISKPTKNKIEKKGSDCCWYFITLYQI